MMVSAETKLLEVEREHHGDARQKQEEEFMRLHNESMKERAAKKASGQ